MGVEINRLTAPDAADAVAIDGSAIASANGSAYHHVRIEDDDDDDNDSDIPGHEIEEAKLAHSPEPASPIELHIDQNYLAVHSPFQPSSPRSSSSFRRPRSSTDRENPDPDDNSDADADADLEHGDLILAHSTGLNSFLSQEDPLTADASTGETAGVYLGILNLYAAAPQLLGTLINFVVFAIVEPGKSRELAGGDHDHAADGDKDGAMFGGGVGLGNATGGVVRRLGGQGLAAGANGEALGLASRSLLQALLLQARDHADDDQPRWNAIGVCMFIGGLSSLGAAYATWRLRNVR